MLLYIAGQIVQPLALMSLALIAAHFSFFIHLWGFCACMTSSSFLMLADPYLFDHIEFSLLAPIPKFNCLMMQDTNDARVMGAATASLCEPSETDTFGGGKASHSVSSIRRR